MVGDADASGSLQAIGEVGCHASSASPTKWHNFTKMRKKRRLPLLVRQSHIKNRKVLKGNQTRVLPMAAARGAREV